VKQNWQGYVGCAGGRARKEWLGRENMARELQLQAELDEARAREAASREAFREREALFQEREAVFQEREAALQAQLAQLSNETTCGKLLDSRLPEFEDVSDQSSSSTTAVGSMVPNSVIRVSIGEKVAAYRVSLAAAFLDKKAIKMSQSTLRAYRATEESFITAFFVETAGNALNQLLHLKGENATLLGATEYRHWFAAKPDVFCFSGAELLMCGEMKRRNLLTGGDDLVLRYNQGDGTVRNTLQQLAGYMHSYQTEHSVLSTYHHTWMAQLNAEGNLLISEAFNSATTGHHSTLNALFYTVSLARDSVRLGTWAKNLPILQPVTKKLIALETSGSDSEPGGESGGGTESGVDEVSQQNMGTSLGLGHAIELNLLQILGKHPTRITFLARMDNSGTLVVIKCYLDKESRDQEAFCYRKLRPLQGTYIPEFLGCAALCDKEISQRFALILSWVGVNLGEKSAGPRALELARDIVHEMHKLGVVHGDLHPRNMTYDSRSKRVFIYDFSDAITEEMVGTRDFARACFLELDSLNTEIQRMIADEVLHQPVFDLSLVLVSF
jgi:hypothetical protein